MNDLDFIGSIFGYLLWGCFLLTKSFAPAILIFTIVLRLLQFPLQVKSQKSMAGNARLQKKQMELQEKYGNDKNKYNEELTKLYEKENVSPMSGCLTSLIPMILLLGVYTTIRKPLTNTLHIASDSVETALTYISGLPVVGASVNSTYGQIEIINMFSNIKDNLTCFSADDISKIELFASGFNLGGLNLLETPSTYGILSWYIIIPILCLASSMLSTMYTMRTTGNAQQQQGCMKAMFYVMPLISAWFAYSVPAAVGVYWICSSVLGFITTVILHKFYNAQSISALEEAKRIAYLEESELSVREANVTSSYKNIEKEKKSSNSKNVGNGKKKGNKKKR